ncbi:hypothetical protein B0H17DRAFT_1267890 [Mycena rosella]|uniref:Uncharacterized protein n=1 Tax=Mycena rosella TaxID=1033263 RepID=A0AAD7G2X7_MYCRO|nr:hypothetical protein B0H17DRAFT_1267890 [Mycena rosella]
MSIAAKTIVATGASSGLGFEVVKQLLQQTQPYNFILGVRDATLSKAAYDALQYDAGTHSVTILPLELSDLRGVRSFAQQALEKLGEEKLDYLMLNAAISKGVAPVGPHGSKWCEAYIVNHLSQHYLIHLLRSKLTASRSRIVFVSSGAVRDHHENLRTLDSPNFPRLELTTHLAKLDTSLFAGSGANSHVVYPSTKFTQFLGTHYWRRQLKDTGCTVVAVAPGFIPLTRLSRHTDLKLSMDMPNARTVEDGAQFILAGFTRDDLPADPEQILLYTGEWLPKDVYSMSLDTELQDKWCPSKDEIEKEAGLSSGEGTKLF